MAQDITITVRDTVTGAKQEVELPDDVPMNELLPLVCEKMREAASADEEGFASSHQLINKTQNFEYNADDTLASKGTQEGDTCLLGYEFDAGRL